MKCLPCLCQLLGRCHLLHQYSHLLHLPSMHRGAHLAQYNHFHPCQSRRKPCGDAHHWPFFVDGARRQEIPHSPMFLSR